MCIFYREENVSLSKVLGKVHANSIWFDRKFY